jgi:hypothetical protein
LWERKFKTSPFLQQNGEETEFDSSLFCPCISLCNPLLHCKRESSFLKHTSKASNAKRFVLSPGIFFDDCRSDTDHPRSTEDRKTNRKGRTIQSSREMLVEVNENHSDVFASNFAVEQFNHPPRCGNTSCVSSVRADNKQRDPFNALISLPDG